MRGSSPPPWWLRPRRRPVDTARGLGHDDHHHGRHQPLGPQHHAHNGALGVRILHALTRRANLPDPSGDGGIPKQAVISAMQQVSNSQANPAQSACRNALPAGGSLSGQAYHPVTARDQHDYLKVATCMRSHGVPNFPDPNFSGGNVSFPIPSSTDTHSTQFNEARQTCQKLIPAGLPYSGSEG